MANAGIWILKYTIKTLFVGFTYIHDCERKKELIQ